MSVINFPQPRQFGCPRCTKQMFQVAHWRYRCDHCDVVFEYQRAIWQEVERGMS